MLTFTIPCYECKHALERHNGQEGSCIECECSGWISECDWQRERISQLEAQLAEAREQALEEAARVAEECEDVVNPIAGDEPGYLLMTSIRDVNVGVRRTREMIAARIRALKDKA